MILPRIINQGPFRVQRSAGALWGTPWLLSKKRGVRSYRSSGGKQASARGGVYFASQWAQLGSHSVTPELLQLLNSFPSSFAARQPRCPPKPFTPGMPRSRGHPNSPRDRSIAKPQDPRRDWCFRTPRRPPPPAPCRKPRLPSVR
jgi:hypothetical protein